jgi:tetratricopeptide (TPR) repeat protein
MAEILAECEDERLRDPRRAVELARKAVEAAGKDPGYDDWRALALARYRAGDWAAAAAAAENASRVRRDAPQAWLILALSHARRGDPEQARPWYEKAARSLDQHPGFPTTRCLRAEAAELLGPPARRNGPPPKD